MMTEPAINCADPHLHGHFIPRSVTPDINYTRSRAIKSLVDNC
ncbi:hypothetical protein [Chamaesiphon sp. VAR_48_metabat_403]|nr:hypothetical protein [Chamaesiphon sp. VAR_48_metabat_403]